MVLLTINPAIEAAVEEYKKYHGIVSGDSGLPNLTDVEVGQPISHQDLIDVSRHLTGRKNDSNGDDEEAQELPWRLDTLLKGSNVYYPPPKARAEPTSEYKALMARLRKDEERRMYEQMVNPIPDADTFTHRFPRAQQASNAHSLLHQPAEEIDEVTYADVNRQMALIINVLVSIIACSVAIWIAARHWSAPQRLALSMSGSGVVAVAEVAIYMGYIRRVKESKDKEVKTVETKEIVETWVIDRNSSATGKEDADGIRFRKGKHR